MKQLIIFYYKHFRFAAVLCLLTLVISNVTGADLTINLNTSSSNVFSLNTSNGVYTANTELTKTSGGYTYKLCAANDCYYYNSAAILIGKTGSYIIFPAIEGKKLTKVTISNNAGAAEPSISICPTNSTTAVTGGTATTVTKNASTSWTLSGTSANTSYRAYITNNKNLQMTALSLEYTNAGASYTLVFGGICILTHNQLIHNHLPPNIFLIYLVIISSISKIFLSLISVPDSSTIFHIIWFLYYSLFISTHISTHACTLIRTKNGNSD